VVRASPSPDADEALAFAGVAGQAAALSAGSVTSAELVERCLRRIAAIDPRLNAFRIVFSEQARAEAREADRRRVAGDSAPLLGVPIAVKDNVDVAGEPTYAGVASRRPAPERDGELVRRLRAAGLIIIGKTTLPELGLWPFTETRTWGVTRNPWDLDRTAGGSSGGSAAAVAAGLVPAAVGNDGGGSIRIPAACCGLVGLKPTPGRVPHDGHGWYGLVSDGFLTRSVLDTALLLDAVGEGLGSLAAAARGADPGRLRVGWTLRAPTPIRVAPDVRRAVDRTVATLADAGHAVAPAPVRYGELNSSFFPRYFRSVHEQVASLPTPARIEKRTATIARVGGRVPPRAVRAAVGAGAAAQRRIVASLGAIDVLVLPILASAPLRVGRYAGAGAARTMNGIAQWMAHAPAFNVAGMPAMAVPAGFDAAGLPVAVQLAAAPGREDVLVSVAAQLERAWAWPEQRPALS
jgi:amidase